MSCDDRRASQQPDLGWLGSVADAVSDERFRLLLDTLPFMAFVIRTDGQADHYNRRFLEYCGHLPGPGPGDRLALLHPEDRERFLAARAEGAGGGTDYVVEARLGRHDAAYRWHRIHNKPLRRNGDIFAWLGTAVDIDEIRRAREALEQRVEERTSELAEANRKLRLEIAERERAETILRESEERYRKLYNRTPLALHSVDADARLIDVNDSWLAMFGYQRQEVLGRSTAEFMTAGSARLYREQGWQEMLLSEGGVQAMEPRFVRRSGEEFDGRLVSRGEFDDTGRFVRSWSAIADITDQRRAEADLRQAQKIEAVGQLTAGVAHDFNNLLTAITGSLELLERRSGLEDGRSAKLLGVARTAAQRGAHLTAQLLAFARKQRLSSEPVDLNLIVQGMRDLLRRTIGGTIRIETDLADVWPALADPTQIELVILNLAINARDAMPAGGAVTIRTRNAILGRPTSPEEPQAGEYAVVSVRDSGTGIAPDILHRVFEPFFTTKEIGRGSGLGLPQVLGVAQQLGGGVRIETTAGVGTIVNVYLPRTARRSEAGFAPAEPRLDDMAGPPQSRLRLLLVDDDDAVRDVIAAILADAGHEVIEADGGALALERLSREGSRIQLMVVDFAMPGMNGLELAKLARRSHPGLPILMVTGYANTGPMSEEPVIVATLQKPVSAADLLSAVQHAADGAAERRSDVVRGHAIRAPARP